MQKVLKGEASKGYKKKKTETETLYNCEKLKRFCRDLRLQVYMYDFMYVDPETIPGEEYFPATKTFAVNYKKMSTLGTVPKHWLGFSYIHSKCYELD